MILLKFSESLWLLSAEYTEVREGAKQCQLKEIRRKMTAVPQTKHEGGLDQDAGKWLDFGSILKVEQTVFAELDMGSKKKNSTVFFNLGIWENEGAITEMIKIISGTGLGRKSGVQFWAY